MPEIKTGVSCRNKKTGASGAESAPWLVAANKNCGWHLTPEEKTGGSGNPGNSVAANKNWGARGPGPGMRQNWVFIGKIMQKLEFMLGMGTDVSCRK